ncbi:MAG: response regulator [Planctomycetota bacterium]|jgi:two-component system alkaline phosphatase synthesis response regulator PhoP
MRLQELTLEMVTTAVGLYLDLAYGSASGGRMPELNLPPDAAPEEVLGLFTQDAREEGSDSSCLRYTMRLGNRNYPFMKLLLQEHIVAGEYYFGVDTHDDMEIKPDYPDYEAWMAVRRFNSDLRRKIEASFGSSGLPTALNLRELCSQRTQEEAGEESGTILVVDDEEDLADAVESLLSLRGYTMHKVYDGPSAIEAALSIQPDMILLDYELPELDGLAVIAALREDESTRNIPVLLCTASKISLGDIDKADGFLTKPYQEELLYKMVDRVISHKESG